LIGHVSFSSARLIATGHPESPWPSSGRAAVYAIRVGTDRLRKARRLLFRLHAGARVTISIQPAEARGS
jgi:hypothetical protein